MATMTLQYGMPSVAGLETGCTRLVKGCGVRPLAVATPLRTTRRLHCDRLKSGLVKPVGLTSLSDKSYFTGKSLGVVFRKRTEQTARRSVVQANALDADASAGGDGKGDLSEIDSGETASKEKRVKIGIYFVTWWTLNVVFNIYNKKVLNAFPYPWLTSTLALAAGSAIMAVSWLSGLVEKPDVDADFLKALAPVALAHTIGHVAATVSMSKVAVSFTHIIKSGEPAISVVVQRLFFGQGYPASVYLSLLPIIGGCGLAAITELNFNMVGFAGAMISNFAFVFRNIFSKKGMVGKNVGGMNYYALLSIMSLVFLTPFALVVEGPKLWISGWDHAVNVIGPHFVWWVAAQSVFYHLYNQVSYMSLNEISPLTFSIGNTMKRVSVIVASVIIFRTPVQAVNMAGAAIAILGTFLYSQAK